MKIAVACEKETVTQHFGHCEQFIVFDVENNEIVDVKGIPNPGHQKGFLPVFLHEKGIDVIISGGMGGGAITIFNEKNINVVTGATGNATNVVKAYITGELTSSNSVCTEHAHKGECH